MNHIKKLIGKTPSYLVTGVGGKYDINLAYHLGIGLYAGDIEMASELSQKIESRLFLNRIGFPVPVGKIIEPGKLKNINDLV